MGLRTGSSTAERGAWPRSLRGTIVAGPTPSRAHDNDCLCLPAASTSHQSEAGKKESPDHHLNPACQPCAEPSSISSFDCRLINARTADNGSAQNGSTNKSAKVVLELGTTRRSVIRGVKKLEALGWVRVERRQRMGEGAGKGRLTNSFHPRLPAA